MRDRNGAGWLLVCGRTLRGGKPKGSVASLVTDGEELLGTADAGAILVRIAPAEAIRVAGRRDARPALWRGPSIPSPTFR
jgi:hypothetical protein